MSSNTIPPWVTSRFSNTVNANPRVHFEHSMYGPMASYLVALFPLSNHFMIKPQALLRRTYLDPNEVFEEIEFLDIEPEIGTYLRPRADPPVNYQQLDPDSDSDSSDSIYIEHIPSDDTQASIDSTGDDTYARGTGHDFLRKYPDFLVVKAKESLDEDILIAIIEMKRDEEDRFKSTAQLLIYLQRARFKRRDAKLKGFLVMGPVTLVAELESAATNAKTAVIGEIATSDIHHHFRSQLSTIATAYWE